SHLRLRARTKVRVRKRSPLLPEPSREQLAQHADAQCLRVSARFRSDGHRTSSELQGSPQTFHTLPLAFADRHLLQLPLEVSPGSIRCIRWQTAQLLVGASHERRCEMLRSQAARIEQYLSPVRSCQVVVETVDWRSDVAAIQTDLAPRLWTQLQPRETRRGWKIPAGY